MAERIGANCRMNSVDAFERVSRTEPDPVVDQILSNRIRVPESGQVSAQRASVPAAALVVHDEKQVEIGSWGMAPAAI
jgi:hypothetical protein